MEKSITFEQLPAAITLLTKEVNEIKQLLILSKTVHEPELQDTLLNIQQAAKFLNLAVPTIYSKVSKRELPSIKCGKKLYFSQTELMDWVKEGKRKSFEEINTAADSYFNNKK